MTDPFAISSVEYLDLPFFLHSEDCVWNKLTHMCEMLTRANGRLNLTSEAMDSWNIFLLIHRIFFLSKIGSFGSMINVFVDSWLVTFAFDCAINRKENSYSLKGRQLAQIPQKQGNKWKPWRGTIQSKGIENVCA
jgi:hypothetical protein